MSNYLILNLIQQKENKLKVKSIEVSSTFGGVISDAPYENIKPSYFDKVIIDIGEGDNEQDIINAYRKLLQAEQIRAFDLLRNRMKAEKIEQQVKGVRFVEKDGKKYPSVTSIIGWDQDFHISDIDLRQYGSRGTIVHYMIEQFIQTGAWLTLEEVVEKNPKLREDASIMYRGNLGLKISDCSHEEFFAQFLKDFEFDEFEQTIFNDKHLYCGRYDVRGKYQGVPSIIDFKTGSTYSFKQLAAYANGDGVEGIEQLVICPVGKTDNKSGCKKPIVTKNVKTEFDNFLKDRAKFAERFGI